MIESIQYEAIKRYGPCRGVAIMLGDQIPTAYCGEPTAALVMASLGYSKTVDIDYNGKAEVNHDLNHPIPQFLHDAGDLLFDGGVLEHVCNIGQALESIVRIMRLDGVVVMANPINCFGESYYGIDPMCYRDFFTLNGFRELHATIYNTVSPGAFGMRVAARILPVSLLKRCAAALKNTKAVKAAILHDSPGCNRMYPAYSGERMRKLPWSARQLWVGVKVEKVKDIKWPNMSMYPK